MLDEEKWAPLTPEEIKALNLGDEVVLKYVNRSDPGSERQFVRALVAEIDEEHGKHRYISLHNRETLPDWAEIGKFV